VIEGRCEPVLEEPVDLVEVMDSIRWRIWIRGEQALAWPDGDHSGVFSADEVSCLCESANLSRLGRLSRWRLPELPELQQMYAARAGARRFLISSPMADFLWKHLDSADYDAKIIWSGCAVNDALGGAWCMNFNNGTALM
jgi:hypothetical protein